MGKFKTGKYADNKDRILELYMQGLRGETLAEALTLEIGKNFNGANIRKVLSLWRGDGSVEVLSNSTTESNDYKGAESFVLSAWNEDGGGMMDIDKYCEFYNLPRQDVSSYKLISHTGTPYYNIVFKENITVEGIDAKEAFDTVIGLDWVQPKIEAKVSTEFTRLIYTDTHIGMCTDIENTAMYATPWNEETLMETLKEMVTYVIANRIGQTLIIDDLGDLLDGWNGETTRGGHKLPQNMNNKEAFRIALEFKVAMIDMLMPHFENIICHNVCCDNHSGDFAVVLNHAFKRLVHERYDNVQVHNYEKFITHYYVGIHAFVLTHGKDHKSLKFGLKPKLDPVQIEKVDHYLKHNEVGSIFKEADVIWVEKGDSHQMLFDYSTAQDFNYMNYPALSPSSEWVQTNFKKGERGFVIQRIDAKDKNIKLLPVLL